MRTEFMPFANYRLIINELFNNRQVTFKQTLVKRNMYILLESYSVIILCLNIFLNHVSGLCKRLTDTIPHKCLLHNTNKMRSIKDMG